MAHLGGFIGTVDEFRVWGVELTPRKQVLNNFKNGANYKKW